MSYRKFTTTGDDGRISIAKADAERLMQDYWKLPDYIVKYLPIQPLDLFPVGETRGPGGDNGMARVNWFNGRFLTAEALRKQDRYWDERVRSVAQTHPAGIAWGLGVDLLTMQGVASVRQPAEGIPPRVSPGIHLESQKIRLQPGLAFDGIGRAIIVSEELTVNIADLLLVPREKRRVVVRGGTQFEPCMCVAPDSSGPGENAGPTLSAGPYILCIEPSERPVGRAKIYGEACPSPADIRCEADCFQGGFALSLVRFPVDVPPAERRSPGDLRGTLSAYYFDIYEHDLSKRWDFPFLGDRSFCRPPEVAARIPGCVPLAMLFLAEDGQVMFLDPWIPRRPQVASLSKNIADDLLGRPSESAATARIMQFQCQLGQVHASVGFPSAASGKLGFPGVASANLGFHQSNLLSLGFKHIPPVGFLPLAPRPVTAETCSLTTSLIKAAEWQAKRYFKGTNVLPYVVVALHDDDIMEDINNAFEKDPIILGPKPERMDRIAIDKLYEHGRLYEHREPLHRWSAMSTSGSIMAAVNAIKRLPLILGRLAMRKGISLDRLVNREVEIVKVVIPLAGLRRTHPVLGQITEERDRKIDGWFELPDAVPPEQGAVPRHFAVYVKQRLVLLDLLYMALEILELLLECLLIEALGDELTTNQLEELAKMFPEEKLACCRLAIGFVSIQKVVIMSLTASAPLLRNVKLLNQMSAEIDKNEAAVPAAVTDPEARRATAIEKTLDAYDTAYPEFSWLKVLYVMGGEPTLQEVIRAAAREPAVDDDGNVSEAPIETEFYGDEHPEALSGRSLRLWRTYREALASTPIAELVPEAKPSIPAGEILRASGAAAVRRFGGATPANAARSALRAALLGTRAEITTLAAPPPAAAVAAYAKLVAKHDGDSVAAAAAIPDKFWSRHGLEKLRTAVAPLAVEGRARFLDAVLVTPRE